MNFFLAMGKFRDFDQTMIEIIYGLILTNVATLFATYRYYQKSKRPPAPPSHDLQEFIKDLMSGQAMVLIKPVNTADIILRSPRNRA